MEDIKVYYTDGSEEEFKHDGKTVWNKNMDWFCFKSSELNYTVFINPVEVKKVESVFMLSKEPVKKANAK